MNNTIYTQGSSDPCYTCADSISTPSNSQEELQNFNFNPELVSHPAVIFIEPFYGGSHKQLIDSVRKHVPNSNFVSLRPKKWHWRARCSALILSSIIPVVTTQHTLFTSSVLNLAELLGLRPDLAPLRKVVYFHENQMVYPVREIKQRDIQFALNEIATSVAADCVLFNSYYNKHSFLNNIKNVLKLLPDYRPKGIKELIAPKCHVLYFMLDFLPFNIMPRSDDVLRIVWPHRWEFDKDPDTFLRVLLDLKRGGYVFKVSLLGELFSEVPEMCIRAKENLAEEILHFGYLENKDDYYKVLKTSHVAVSTAQHEFFGVSMMEATYYGCLPLVPNRLVYPEMYPERCLYNDEADLGKILRQYCSSPGLAMRDRKESVIDFDRFSETKLLQHYLGYIKTSK